MEPRKEIETAVDTKSKNSIVWEFVDSGINMEPAEFEKKYDLLREELKHNQINNWGEFLHIAGVMLHYSKLKVIPETEKEILAMLRKKIAEYAATGNFEPLSDEVLISGGWEGWGIFEFASLGAKGIIDTILKEQNTRHSQTIRREFLEFVKNIDNEDTILEFCRHIRHYPETGKFSKQPVFSYLNDEEKENFFRTVAAHEVRHIQNLMISLQRRYNLDLSNESVDKYLLPEKSFVESFNKYAENMLKKEERAYNPGIEKYHHILGWLKPIIQEFNRLESNK